MNLKRTAIAMLCAVILLVSGAVPKAFADWYDDIESGTWVEIKGQNFVADTFMGVKAYYNASGNSVYHCGEVVERFYREALGLDVQIRSTEPRLRMNTPGYKLVKPDFPKAGDVVFVSSAMRGGKGDHWAIVKYYENGYLVLFEQNVIYNGCAGVNRRLKYPSDSYYIFSPVRTDGETVTVSNEDKPSETEKTTVTTSAVSTTEKTTTTKPETTTKPATTQKITTTAKPTTTKAAATTAVTTAKPTTTQKITTTAKVTTTKAVTTTKPTTTAPETTTAVSTMAAETTSEWYYTYTYTAVQTESEVFSSYEHTEIQTEESKKATLPLAIVCGVIACGVAALAVILIKKKR